MKYTDGNFYAVERVSPSIEKTPEGYLICRSVPISRVGTFDYSAIEAGLPAGPDGIVKMQRTADELFAPDTIRSFEGKDVVIGHSTFVDPKNWRRRSIGTVQNVRQGEGGDAGKLLADLLIKDADGIKLVEGDRLREVSCGYDAQPVSDSVGHGHQVAIVGNHVALVPKGRCGDSCRIRDGEMPNLKTILRRAFKDGEEEKFNEALDKVDVKPIGDEDPDGAKPITPEVHAKAPEDRLAVLEHEYGEMGQKIDAMRQMLEKLVMANGGDGEKVGDEDTGADPEPAPEDKPVTDECAKGVLDEAEELCPGMKRPVGDAKDDHFTVGQLARVKRQALKDAGVKTFGDAAMLDGVALDTAFKAALMLKRAEKNPTAKRYGDASPAHRPTNAELNKRFSEFWKGK